MTIVHLARYASLHGSASLERERAHGPADAGMSPDRSDGSPRAHSQQDQVALGRLELIKLRIKEGFYSRNDVLTTTLEGVARDLERIR